MSFGVDYAWFSTDLKALIAALKAHGVTFVARYLSHSSGKNLTPDEAAALSAAKIAITVVWETAADRALAGHAAGAQDARDALAEAKACGMPAGRPIFFAVDFDASNGQEGAISTYLDGAASVLGKDRTGVYGGYNVVKHALDGDHCHWAWQTYAWSGGKWDTRAQLQQYSNDHIIGGAGLDYDRSEDSDFGQWRIGWTPSVDPTPHPDPTPTEDDMPTGLLTDGANAITPIALPRGRYKTIGFTCDNGLEKLDPAKLRVAVSEGGGKWHVEHITVDSAKGQAVITFPNQAATDGISVQREDAGTVGVAFEVS
jgi:hypothetical protein